MHIGKFVTTINHGVSRSELFRHSWLLYFTDLFVFVMTSGHLWLLAYFSGKEEVAIFGAVSRFMLIITTSLAMMRLTILPTIGHLYTKRKYADVEKLLRISATIAGLPAIIGLILIIALGKELLLLIYGSHYIVGYSALIILAGAHLINAFTGTPALLMLMASKEEYLFFFALISGSIGMLISVLLVKQMSYLAVSIGAGTGIVLYNVLMVWYCKKALSINTLMSLPEVSNVILKIRSLNQEHAFSKGLRKIFK